MNQALKMVGDVISSLQTDSTGKPADTAVLQVLDTMASSNSSNPSVEGFAAPGQQSKLPLKTSIKVAAILTLAMLILSIPALNTVMSKMFANTFVRLMVIALIFFVTAMYVVKKFAKVN
jgi:hypothetical protein